MEDLNDELLEESDYENVVGNMDSGEEETLGQDDPVVPEVGMMFDNENEMFDLYKRYAYHTSFPVRKRNSKKGDDGVLRYVTFTCSREGRRSSNASDSTKPKPISQTDCKARISASSDSRGMWRINTFHLDHNHETSPSKSRLYRCNRELSANVKCKLEVNDIAGIPLYKSYDSAVAEAGVYEKMTCIEKDCRNYIEQARCSGFYFSIDLDDKGRLKNVFWADNTCR
ncbi:protein FAR1-RELATED SEQUENCE 5-like [Olea europaea var. sylvestris]|uniref:protein FAR1-RELATED SEQUENCE 5-like n=1 Tax=Olea europaea var. sylvestris TaxID=158386 RepID=UPI000C1D5CEE|nr:protein FAR1-RELATED SEQUENCE 5-like [Olea europaea var. sylvestris]